MKQRSQWSVALWMLAVFASGITVGVFAHYLYMVKTVNATTALKPAPKRDPEDWRRVYIDTMRTRLTLTDAQIGQLKGILDETKARFKDLKDRHKQETDTIRADQIDRIRGMLTAQQRPEYEKLREERERKAKEQAAKEQAAKAGN